MTFNNGTKKTVTVKINKTRRTKPFSLKDIKIKLIRSYWNGSKACIEYSITNNSSKNLNKIRIFYSGTISETVSGYTTINSSIPKGTTKTFITRVGAYDYLEGVRPQLPETAIEKNPCSEYDKRKEPNKDAITIRKRPHLNVTYISERLQEALCDIFQYSVTTVTALMGCGKPPLRFSETGGKRRDPHPPPEYLQQHFFLLEGFLPAFFRNGRL